MMNKKILLLALVLILTAVVVSGCGNRPEPTPTIDPVAVMTQVAGTVQAEVTQNALLTPSATTLAATATLPAIPTTAPLPIPTTFPNLPAAPTVPPELLPDRATFIADIDVQDGDVFWQGERFTKTWQLENTGTTTWDQTYRFIYLDGDITSEELVFNLTSPVSPGEFLNISVKMQAPDVLGSYTNYWQMHNGEQFFGDIVNMTITVGTEWDKTATPAG